MQILWESSWVIERITGHLPMGMLNSTSCWNLSTTFPCPLKFCFLNENSFLPITSLLNLKGNPIPACILFMFSSYLCILFLKIVLTLLYAQRLNSFVSFHSIFWTHRFCLRNIRCYASINIRCQQQLLYLGVIFLELGWVSTLLCLVWLYLPYIISTYMFRSWSINTPPYIYVNGMSLWFGQGICLHLIVQVWEPLTTSKPSDVQLC